MDQTAAKAPTLRPAVFRDGLGERRRMADASGIEKLEVLCLGRDLATVDGFEAALRDRVAKLASFRHASFARVRTVERLNDPAATLVVASEPTKGTRLSELLKVADGHGLTGDGSAEWCLIRQLTAAVSTLHQHAPDAAHGAIAPERIVITPDARLVIVEHVLGGALQQVRFPADQYWKELRIALPPGNITELNRRADVTQIGVVALSLILGRLLSDDEYPARVGELVESAWAKSAVIDIQPTPTSLRSWLARALQIDARQSFPTAVEAAAELEHALQESGYTLTPADVEAFLARCQGHRENAPRTVAPIVATPPKAPTTAAPPAPVSPVAIPVATSSAAPRAVEKAETFKSMPTPPQKATVLSVTGSEPRPTELPRTPGMSAHVLSLVAATARMTTTARMTNRRRLIAAAVVLLVLSGVGWAAASRYFEVSAERGTSAASTDVPPMNTTTPAPEPALAPPVPTATVPAVGQLDVRSEPAGATVTVDGVRRGVTPLTLNDVAPGRHTLVLDNGHGSTTRTVMVEAGLMLSVVTQLAAPPVAPTTGSLTVTAPGDLQLFENGRLIGNSQGRLTIAAGPHHIEFVNEALGYRSTRTVQVVAGANVSVTLEFPKGTLALNAVPWAEVWVDGVRVGETPIGNLPMSLGTHEVVFRNPDLGEQRMVATVTLTAPTRLSVDLRKK